MPNDTVHVLQPGLGDLMVTWNPTVAREVEDARATIAAMRAQGFEFLLLDGSPAPAEITAGINALSCRRIPAEEVVQARDPAAEPPPSPATPIGELGLSPRPAGALRRAIPPVETVEQLTALTVEEVEGLAGIGAASLQEIHQKLAARNRQLGTTPPAGTSRRVVASRPLRGG